MYPRHCFVFLEFPLRYGKAGRVDENYREGEIREREGKRREEKRVRVQSFKMEVH